MANGKFGKRVLRFIRMITGREKRQRVPFSARYFMVKRTPFIEFVFVFIERVTSDHNAKCSFCFNPIHIYIRWFVSIYIYYCLHYILIPFSAIAKCMVFVTTVSSYSSVFWVGLTFSLPLFFSTVFLSAFYFVSVSCIFFLPIESTPFFRGACFPYHCMSK